MGKKSIAKTVSGIFNMSGQKGRRFRTLFLPQGGVVEKVRRGKRKGRR